MKKSISLILALVIAFSGISLLTYAGDEAELVAPELIECTADNECITLCFEGVASAEYYNIYRKTNGGSWEKAASKYDGTVYCDYSVKSGNVYTYTAKAGAGEIFGSYDKEGLSVKYVKLPTPVISSVKFGVNKITVSWKKISSCDGYILYRRTDKTDWEEIGEFKNTVTQYTDTALKSNNKYYYTLKCFKGELVSNYNPGGKGTFFLAVPVKLSASSDTKGVKITWNKVSGANKYIIGRKTSKTDWVKIAEVGNVSSYTDKTAKTSVTYSYTVVSCKDSFKGLYKEAGVKGRYVPVVTLKSVKNTSKGAVTLNWSLSEGSSGYIVYKKANGGSSWSKVATVKGAAKLTYTDKTAKKGVTYIYNVKPYYGTCTGSFKNGGVKIKVTK